MRGKWTEFQRKAIETHNRNLLVSAAAGSGKTAVLAERCAYLVCEADPPCDADELLVVTFTVAAAEEMRKRIGQAIAARAAASDDPRLLRQPLLLAAAQIGTIHSLCSSIIRRHFHVLGIDPGFRLLDEDEARLLRHDLADQLVEERLEDETDTDFRKLLEHYAGGSPQRIVETVLGLSSKLSSLIEPDSWLALRRERLVEAAERPIRDSFLGQEMLKILQSRCATLEASARRLAATLDAVSTLPGYGRAVHAIADVLEEWKQAIADRPFDLAADIIRSTEFETLPRMKESPEKLHFKARIDALRANIRSFAKVGVLCFAEEELQANTTQTLWAVDQLTRIVHEFEQRYALAKQNAGNLDFTDLERFALRLIRDADTGESTTIAAEYRRQFKHVLIDEYQDVNELQDMLLGMLASESHGNLFCVGDVKQSIYRFRQADPARFIARYKRYKDKETHAGEVIDLQTNFRSRGPLLEVLNRLFEVLMTRESAEVEYNRSQRLVPGATFPDGDSLFTGSPIELHVIEDPAQPGGAMQFEADEHEAILIASRIQTLLGRDGSAPKHVADRDGGTRPIEPRDIAILLRTMRIKAERYAAILRRANIPVQADSTTGFFESAEIRDLLCTLSAIDNERNEYDLAGYLRSPLAGLTHADDRLAKIRLAYPSRDAAWFHQALHRYVIEHNDDVAASVKAALDQLARWRAISQDRPVADVVWAILSDTSYAAWCAGLPDGEQRVANLLDLHKRARAFERFRRPTLARFLHYLSNLEDQSDLGMPSVTADGQNAVRILSVHKSKGLEFPVVIVPDLGKEHNLRDATEKIIVDETVGLGLRVVDTEKEIHYPSLASMIGQHEVRRRALAEELRVLYVAGTRAREHLILIGTAGENATQTWDDAWTNLQGPIPAGDVLSGRSMLDWVGPAAAIAKARSPGSVDRRIHTSQSLEQIGRSQFDPSSREAENNPLADLRPLHPAPPLAANVKAAIERITYVYPHEAATHIPATAAVTTLTKAGQSAPGGTSPSAKDVVQFDPILRLPRSIEGDTAPTPADIGSVTHTVLQHLDFNRPCDDADVDAQIESMIARRFMRPNQSAHVDRAAIHWFLQTDLGRLLRARAGAVRREFDLTYSVAPPNVDEASGDLVMVRGRLDAVLVEADGLTIIDYKTDRVTEVTLPSRVDFYRGQMDAYRTQLARVTHRAVKATYLVFLTPRQVIAI